MKRRWRDYPAKFRNWITWILIWIAVNVAVYLCYTFYYLAWNTYKLESVRATVVSVNAVYIAISLLIWLIGALAEAERGY